MKLKLWVKVVLVSIVIISIIALLNNQGNKAVEKCMEQGYSQNYCELKLR